MTGISRATTSWRRAIRCSALLAAASILFAEAGSAQTTVIQDGECAFTIVIPIEVHGPLATPELADRWKKNIEARWNGATDEMIRAVADGVDVVDRERLDIDRNRLNKAYRDFLQSIGADGQCAEVNCCRICVRVDIRVRKDKPDPKYHQIEVVPDGSDVRSYVRHARDSTTFKAAATGAWRTSSSADVHAPEAHESGHLLGLDDKYDDVKDEHGHTHGSRPQPGHENDLMANNAAWPQESAFTEILKLAGFTPPNCCKDPTQTSLLLNNVLALAYGGIRTCNHAVIQGTMQQLQDLRSGIVSEKFSLLVKFQFLKAIDARLQGLKDALIDCPPPTGTSVRIPDGSFIVTTGFDGQQWCTYGSGTGFPTIATPIGGPPAQPGGPVSGPPTGPGTPIIITGPPPGPIIIETPSGTPPGPTPPSGPPSPPETPAAGPPSTPPTGKPPETPVAGPPAPPPSQTDKPPGTIIFPPIGAPPETPIIIFVKATQSVLEGQPADTPAPGQGTALFAPKPDLPWPEDAQTGQPDTAFAEDPNKCVTGQGGECQITLSLGTLNALGAGFDLTPQVKLNQKWGSSGSSFRIEQSVPQSTGGVIETTGFKVIPDFRQGLPDKVNVVPDTFNIGDRSFLRLGFDQPFGLNFDFDSHVNKLFSDTRLFGRPVIYIIDYCRDKQPGPPLGAPPASFSSLNQALPAATVRLRLSIQDRLRARP